MIRVSVVIPVYNVEKYLPSCLDSVLGQTLKDIEVICVDDHSPDGSPKILDEYAAKDERVKVVHLPENRQQGYARNVGMDMARGEYLYLLDSDDMIEENALEELCAAADQDALDAVYFDSQVIYESPELKEQHSDYPVVRTGVYEDRVYTGAELFSYFVAQQDWTCYIQRQFFRRDFLNREGLRFPPDRVEHEDEVFAFKAILLAARAKFLKKYYFIRRYREDSVMTRGASPRDFHGYFMCWFYMAEFLKRRRIQLPAAEQLVLNMYYLTQRFYSEFRDREDLEDWFVTKESRDLLYMYESRQKIEGEGVLFDPGLLKKLSSYRHLWIFGAGIIGKRVFSALAEKGFIIDGFLVSKRDPALKAVLGRPVLSMEEARGNREGAIALMAVKKGFIPEVRETLEKEGWEYVSYRDTVPNC